MKTACSNIERQRRATRRRAPPLLPAPAADGAPSDANDGVLPICDGIADVEPVGADDAIDAAEVDAGDGDDFSNGHLSASLDELAAGMVAEVDAIASGAAALDTDPPASEPVAPTVGPPDGPVELDDRCVAWRSFGGRKRPVGRLRFWGDACIEVRCLEHSSSRCFHHMNFRRRCDIAGAKSAAVRWLSLMHDEHGALVSSAQHQLSREAVGKHF